VTKKKHQSIVSLPKVVTIVSLTLVAVLSVDFGRKALENYQIKHQVEWLREQVDVERETNAELQERLQYVSSDAYVEKIARERLKMVKDGETAVMVIPVSTEESSLPGAPAVREAQGEQAKPYWQQWANLLLGSVY
jgi:cell division protein FtsB